MSRTRGLASRSSDSRAVVTAGTVLGRSGSRPSPGCDAGTSVPRLRPPRMVESKSLEGGSGVGVW